MAGDWVKLEKATLRKPELFAIAKRLHISKGDALYLLLDWFCWLDENYASSSCKTGAEFGDDLVTLLFADEVDSIVSFSGFASALLAVGWLKTARNGTVSVTHFDWHNGKTAKNRALAQKRMKRSRDADERTKSAQEANKKRTREEVLNTSLTHKSEKQTAGFMGNAAHEAPNGTPPKPAAAAPKRGRPPSRVNGTNPRALGTNPRAQTKDTGLPAGRWWLTEAATYAAAELLGVGRALANEDWEHYRGRIRAAIAARKQH